MKSLRKERYIRHPKARLTIKLFNQKVKTSRAIMDENSEEFARWSLVNWDNPSITAEELYDISELKSVKNEKK